MFKLSTQIFLLFVALMLSACANIANRDQFIATPTVVVPEFPVTAVLDLPPLEVRELPIPIIPLNERARIVMSESEIQCMARNIYFEAKGESEAGQIGVGYVVLNRMADKRFPNTVCGVIAQKYKGVCQFSWRCDGKSDVPTNQMAYERALRIAREVMEGNAINPIGNSLFFHATSIRKGKLYAGDIRIGGHRFYGGATVARL